MCMWFRIAGMMFVAAFVQACDEDGRPAPRVPDDTLAFHNTFRIVNEYPHDEMAFTQGPTGGERRARPRLRE